MGSRRTNVIIVIFVLALLAGSLYIIATKETKLGLDLSGGTQLIYEGQPTAQNTVVDPEDVDRAIEIIRDRVDALGVSEPEIAPLGIDADPDQPPGRPGRGPRDRAGRTDGAAQLLRLRAQRGPARRRRRGGHPGQRRSAVDDELLQRGRAGLAAEHEMRRRLHRGGAAALPVREAEPPATCRRARVESGGPVRDRRGAGGARRATGRSSRCRRGRSSSRTRRDPESPDAPPQYFVLKDKPAAQRRGHREPRAELRRDATRRTSPSTSPTRASRRSRRSPPTIAARGFAAQSPPVLVRDRARRRDRLAAGHRLRGEPGRDRRPHRRPDLRHRRSAGGPGPGRVPEDRRAADRPPARQPEHRHRDARPAGARSGLEGGPDRPDHRRALLPPLLPLPRPDRDPRAGRLRGLLPGDDEADPDHADAAGHRRPDPDDRRRRRLERRHLRANKGGVPQGALDDLVDHDRLPARDRDDHRRERDHPADRVHPLRAGDGRRQGLRLHARHRHDRLAADRGRLHPRRSRPARPQPDPALAGVPRRPREVHALAFRLRRRQPLVLLHLRRDPADRRLLVRDQAARLRDRLRVGDEDQRRAGHRRQRRRGPGVAVGVRDRRRRRDQDPGGREPGVRLQRLPDPGQDHGRGDERSGPRSARDRLRLRDVAPTRASRTTRSGRRSASRWRGAPAMRSPSPCC